MTDKEQIIVDGVEVLKEKINMCFILLLNKLETPETIEQTIYEHLDAFVKEWKLARKTQECEELQKRELNLKLNETHHKNKIKKLKKRILKDRIFFKNKISKLKLAREQFLQALEHFNWQIDLLAKKNDEMLQSRYHE